MIEMHLCLLLLIADFFWQKEPMCLFLLRKTANILYKLILAASWRTV